MSPMKVEVSTNWVRGGQVADATVRATPAKSVASIPEFVEVPRPGQVCPWSGLRRGMIFQLIRQGRIRSVCLRQPGRLRGKRLVHLPSVLELLRRNMEGGSSE